MYGCLMAAYPVTADAGAEGRGRPGGGPSDAAGVLVAGGTLPGMITGGSGGTAPAAGAAASSAAAA